MLLIDIKDFRLPTRRQVAIKVDEDEIASGLSALGEEWKTPLALRVRIKSMTRKDPFAKAARVEESDSEWRINVYVPVFQTAELIPNYEAKVNRFIGLALATVAKGRGSEVKPTADSLALGFVSVKRAQGSK